MKLLKASLCLFFAFIFFVACSSIQKSALEKTEYREDIEPISNRFPLIVGIESCFWKADSIGSFGIGPSSYWMKGFLVLSDGAGTELTNLYEWEDAEIVFPVGMNPDITGLTNFQWSYSREFSDDVKGSSFVGDFFFDVKMGVIYFDLESN